MREGWKKVKFSNLFHDPKKAIISGPFGSNLKSSEYQNEGVPLVRLQNVDRYRFLNKNIIYVTPQKAEELSSHSYKAGDILITKLGAPLGKACVAPEVSGEGIILADIVRVRLDSSSVDKNYMVYQLNSSLISDQLEELTTGATRPRVTLKNFRELKFILPPLQEQKQIAHLLNQSFAAIDQATANIEKNIENAKELFQSKLNEIFSQKGKDWEEKKFKEVCVLQRGFDLPTRLRKKGDFELITSSGIKDSHIEYKVQGPGVITGRSGSIGNVYYTENNFWPLNTTLYIKDFKGNNAKYIYYFLENFDLKRFASGAGVPTLNRNFVHDEKVMSTNNEKEQIKIVKTLDSLIAHVDELVRQYNLKVQELEKLKKSILHKAFSGELTQKEIEV